LILRKISKIGATRYQILRLKCTKFDFCWCWGSASAPSDPLAVFKGPTSKGGWGKRGDGKGMGREREEEDRGGEG